MYIPEKLENITNVKREIKFQLNKTRQDTNVTFRQLVPLIDNIPNSGAMTQEDINTCANILISINGENA